MDWMLMPLRRYAEFSGRSRRKEYWMYALLLLIVGLVVGMVEVMLELTEIIGPYGPLSAVLGLATFVPSLAVTARRLHDTDRSGWWMLVGVAPYAAMVAALLSGSLGLVAILGLIALFGMLGLLILMCLDGTKGPNRYGEDPKGGPSSEVFA
jgi:uncharacterized membrane protein YhaH (DUF805 family)